MVCNVQLAIFISRVLLRQRKRTSPWHLRSDHHFSKQQGPDLVLKCGLLSHVAAKKKWQTKVYIIHIEIKSKCRGVPYHIHSPSSYCPHGNSVDDKLDCEWCHTEVWLEAQQLNYLAMLLLEITNQRYLIPNTGGMYVVVRSSTSYPHARLWLLFKELLSWHWGLISSMIWIYV